MKTFLLSDIIAANRDIGKKLIREKKYQIVILSNITCTPIKDILEYCLRREGINAYVHFGNYDNIVQEAVIYKKSNLVIIFWELANITEGFHYKSNILGKEEIDHIVKNIQSDIDSVFSALGETSLVLFNTFSSAVFNSMSIENAPFDTICEDLNDYVMKMAHRNVKIIDIDKILMQNSVVRSVDFRYFYSSKALYSLDFLKSYVEFIKPIIMSANGRSKKALIFDCDNTLWKGIVGEEGFDGIECSEKTKGGSIFQEVQYIALELNKRGIILGLCSKNNPDDVMNILKNHPGMTLNEQHFTIMKLNWKDKVSNLREIAQELNIGLDSLVFIDDSDFEINYVRRNLPEITVVQVPKKISDYPQVMRRLTTLFFNLSSSIEDFSKIEMYQQQFQREDQRKKFGTTDDYLRSLGIIVSVTVNDVSQIERIAQLTQKTNQFNLTTKRYTESDIKKFMDNENNLVITFGVEDRFGGYGLTGLCIICCNQSDRSSTIDSFLMSCRIIGRNIELAFFDYLISLLKKRNIHFLRTIYLETRKNVQVELFYEKIGCELIKATDNEKIYCLKLNKYIPQHIDYIKIFQNEV